MRSHPSDPAKRRVTAQSLERYRIPYVLLIALALATANVAAVVLSLVAE